MYELLAIFSVGILAKLTDLIVDEGLDLKRFGYFLGIVYGILIGYVLISNPILASLGLAITISVIVTRKIDHLQHALGIASMLVILGIFGMPSLDPILLVIFLIGGIVDEIMSDLADRNKLKGFLKTFFSYRLTLELLTFLVSLITGLWILFMGMILFDAGYILTERIGRRFT